MTSAEDLPPAAVRAPDAPSPGGAADGRSSYLNYLPGLYRGDPFLGRFLLVFEHILGPIERAVANLPHYVDPALAPENLLQWLGSWLALAVDDRWPEGRRRELIRSAASLYRWRGTKRGLSQLINLYTGVEPEIEELSAAGQPFRFRVTLRSPPGQSLDEELLRAVIQLQKPAWAGFELTLSDPNAPN